MSFVAYAGEIKMSYFNNNCSESFESVRKFLAPVNFM